MKVIKYFYLNNPIIKVFYNDIILYKFNSHVCIVKHIRFARVSMYQYYILDYKYNLMNDIYNHHTVYNMLDIDHPLIISERTVYGYGGHIAKYDNVSCIPFKCINHMELSYIPYVKYNYYCYHNILSEA